MLSGCFIRCFIRQPSAQNDHFWVVPRVVVLCRLDCIYYINWPNFIARLCFFLKLFSKICSLFHAWTFDDVCHEIWISEKSEFDYLNNEKNFQSEIKNIFPCFTKCSPLSLNATFFTNQCRIFIQSQALYSIYMK